MPVVFVYGALMRHPTIKVHGQRAEVHGYGVRFVGPGVRWFEPRFLGLVESPGEVAHGVVVEVNDAAWEQMSRHEVGYEARTVITVVGDVELDARAFVLRAGDVRPEAWPSRRYAELVLEGAEHHGLPEHVVRHYREAVQKGPRLTSWLFGMNGPIRILVPVLGPRLALGAWVGAHVAVFTLAIWALVVLLGARS
jgi:hypothetical protein